MKEFWRDYCEVCKNSLGFYKKHWLGSIIGSIICFVIGAGATYKTFTLIEKRISEKSEE